jgi:hypothetical protein
MAAAAAAGREYLPEFLKKVLYPSALPSLREGLPEGQITVMLHTARGAEPREIILRDMFPFMTLQDIKLALYLALGKDDAAIPEFVYLATHGASPGKTYMGGRTAPVDFTWDDPGAPKGAMYLNFPPFELAAGAIVADKRFVDDRGERRIIEPLRRERLTIEDSLFKRGQTIGETPFMPTLHAYLYRDVSAAVEGDRPIGASTWNGRLRPFFPFLSATTQPDIAEYRTRTQRLATIFKRRQQFAARLETLLEEGTALLPLTLTSVRLLRLTWSAKKDIPGIEAQFYEAAVSERRPFMRLIPTEGTGISKVYLKDGKTPDIADPQLLLNWAQTRSPTSEQDFAFAKILLRSRVSNLPPLYATLRLFNDGSADAIVEPPRGIRKLDPRGELGNYGALLLEGLDGLPHLKGMPEIGHAGLVLGVTLPRDPTKALTQTTVRKRLPPFSAFFQEIAPLPGERPIIALRYKLVSNFVTEDRVQAFISQVKNRQLVQGEGDTLKLVQLVADEFQLDMDEARRRVGQKMENDSEAALVVPETKDYMLQYNPGIDVSIYAQHPLYTFHLYRVNSLENLQRVVTLLSLLISAKPEELSAGAAAAAELRTAEAAEAAAGNAAPGAAFPEAAESEAAAENEFQILGENEAEAEGSPPALGQQAAPGSDMAAADAAGIEGMGMGYDDFGEYGGEDVDPYGFGEVPANAQTLEEEAAAAEAAKAARQQGTPFLEEAPATQAAAPAAAPVPALPKGSVEALRQRVEAAAVAPQEEMQEAAEEEPATAEPAGSFATYFIRKLQEADRALFSYTPSAAHPSLKRYVSMCQPTYGRQPAVMNEARFQAMREEYEEDNIAFYVYPLQPGEPTPKGVVERDYFTVLRYGTTKENQNYYICSRYYCTRDEIIILERDLDGTAMRRPKGAAKKAGECPFCRGTVIKNKRFPGPNETILEREIARAGSRRHLYIRMLGKTPHPGGFHLPCCFIDDIPVKFSSPAFEKYRNLGMPPPPKEKVAAGPAAEALLEAEEQEEAEIEPTIGPRDEAGYPILDYYVTLASITRKYIVGGEKMPLEVGIIAREAGKETRGEAQIGLLPPELDSYFDQDPTRLVSRSFNPQRINPGGQGFLRIGVENRMRYKNDSFLAAVAPYFMKNTAQQMKQLLDEKISPRVFLALNYGNMAIEFYDPTGEGVKPLPPEQLKAWASDELDIDKHQENEQALQRAYMSYETFRRWLFSKETKKEFRHFALFFAQSSLMRRPGSPGISFIVLDMRRDGKLSVRCPPYGLNADLMATNDVAFLLHHWSGVWEPIFYVDNRAPEARGIDLFTLIFQFSAQGQWPPIVRQRVQEYITQCNSGARAVYTDQSDMNPYAMIPASVVKRVMFADRRVTLEGVMRDSYNHIAALLYKERAAPEAGYYPIPVVDDGELFTNKQIFLDWDDPAFTRAPIDRVLAFYKTFVEEKFRIYPGFSPVRIVKSRSSQMIEAVQLRNGLYVPCAPPSSEEARAALVGQPLIEVGEMEWEINHEISLGTGETEFPGEKDALAVAEFQEIFEHLRLTFSNWLAGNPNGKQFREQLEAVIFSRRLPLYEKRKRLEILLMKPIMGWITTDNLPEDKERKKRVSLLRVDCRLRDEKGCDGRCVWRRGAAAADAAGAKEGRCLIHSPEETRLGEREDLVSAPRVLLLRLIEELLRYGERRRQLLSQEVHQMATLERPIVLPAAGTPGGKQKIFPEKSTAWFELLRLEWAKKPDEKPIFAEEMSRDAEVAEPLAAEDPATALPATLITLLGGAADPKIGALRLLRAPFPALLTIMGINATQLSVNEDTASLERAQLLELTRMTGRIIVQINIAVDPPTVSANKPFRIAYPTVPAFVVTSEGPALIVLDPAKPELLKREDMPAGLLDIVNKAKGVLGLRPAAPPAAAAAAPPAAPPAAPTMTIAELRRQKQLERQAAAPPAQLPSHQQANI